MTTKNTNSITLYKGDVLSPKMVLELELLPGATLGWLYGHWEEIGGVTRGNKKFILMEKLYANLKGEEREILHKGVEEQRVIHASQIRDESNQLVQQNGSKSSGSRNKKTDQCSIIDHSNDFGLVDPVQ